MENGNIIVKSRSNSFIFWTVLFFHFLNTGFCAASRENIISCPGKLRSVSSPMRKRTSLEDNAAWMKDPYQVSDRLFYMGYTKFLTRQLYEYETIDEMIGGKPNAFYHLRESVDGTGFVVYDRSLFFTTEGTNQIQRYDLSTQSVVATVDLPSANYGGTSPYAIGLSTDIDLAVDENGLWAIYATEYNEGKIVISRLKHHNLEIVKTWTTDYDKLSALNAFMVCGVLYVVRYDTLTIDHMFNTTSNIGTDINIRIPGLRKNTSTINYNPKEQKLYVWDRKMAVTYQLNFEPIIVKPPTTTSTTTTTRRTTVTTARTTTVLSHTLPPPVVTTRPQCQGVNTGGIDWPSAYYDTIATERCPGISGQGKVFWVCAGNVTHPNWDKDGPDYSRCASEWIREIEGELKDERTNAAELSRRFTDTLRQEIDIGKQLNSWDIKKSVQLLRELLNKATSERQSAAVLAGSALKTASLLLDPSIEDSWNALALAMQNNIASELVRVVEDTAFFLAYDISTTGDSSAAPAQNKLNWSERMVSLGIRVDPIPPDHSELQPSGSDYEKIIWVTGQGDTVRLDTNAVLDSIGSYGRPTRTEEKNQTTTRHLAVVLLSFRNLGQYLKDEALYVEHIRPTTSRVLSVSAASITRSTVVSDDVESPTHAETSVIVNRHQRLALATPLRMTIAHKRTDLKYNACAFWNFNEKTSSGRWWRKGCYDVSTNTTHSTCECNHMTSFAVLSSNARFPVMGFEGNAGIHVTTITAPVVQRDLPILRAGLGVSLFFLVLVAATLFPLSASKRLQSDIHTVHKNLIVSLIATEVVFLCGIDRTLVPDVCGAVAGLLHFGLLATFTWAALDAYHLMVVLGDVTERRDRWRWYYAVGYGLPTVVVAVSAAVDHTGYGTVAVCWLQTDGPFIWSFIGPCCFVIICCIIFLSVTLYRLRLFSVTFSDAAKHKSIRSGVARSCALMFLLCALWSCGVLWLSNFQPRATAILFCILSSFHGITSFFLHCMLPSEVRSHYAACFSLVAKSSRQPTELSRHMSTNSHSAMLGTAPSQGGTIMRHDLTAQYGGYFTTTTGVTTTLLPASAIDQGRCVSDGDITRMMTLDNLQHSTQRGRREGSAAFDLTNETNSTIPQAHSGHRCDGGCVSNHLYEQPLPQIPACSTIASSASGHYNHLHEHYPSGSHHQLAPPSQCCRHQHRRSNHLYETMDHLKCEECSAEMGVHIQMGEDDEPRAVHYQHCFGNSQHRTVAYTAPARGSGGAALHSCCVIQDSRIDLNHCRSGSTPNDRHLDPQLVGRGHLTHGSQSRLNACRRGHIQMGTVGLSNSHDMVPPQLRQKPSYYHGNRAGRSSDPLSTDQGYDTDSQQQGCRGCCDSHSDHDNSCSPRPPSLPKSALVLQSADNASSVVQSANNTVLQTTDAAEPRAERHGIIAPIPKRACNRRNSASELSDCASENDREVERITALTCDDTNDVDCDIVMDSSRDRRNSRRGEETAATGNEPNDYNNDVTINSLGCQKSARKRDDMIDTAYGGRLSVAESVTSWCAHAGSNPRAINSSYGKHIKGKKEKKTADPNVILANARMRAEQGETQPHGRSKTYVYTLPGTAAAGTKAKIDLKNGGISMITNLQ